MPAILGAGVAAMAGAAGSSKQPQVISSTLWALARFRWQDAGPVGVLAAAIAKQASRAEPQALSNALWALSQLGWYEAAAYSRLVEALVGKGSVAGPQDLSKALLACTEACHWNRSTEQLAALLAG